MGNVKELVHDALDERDSQFVGGNGFQKVRR